jgi:putative thioredoxin
MSAKDVTDATFDSDVVEASRALPVVVDFWAPWCAPCRALAPILEKLAAEHAGEFVLAKMNTDRNPDTAARFGIRGIPAVKAFRDGQVAAEFTGAVPESAARAFLKKILPGRGEKLRQAAAAALAGGDADAAEARLREALEAEPRLHAARVDLAELLVARDAWDDAGAALAELPEHERDERAMRLASRIALRTASRDLPGAAELRARLERAPGDLSLRQRLAERLAADGEFEAALEQLLEVVRAGGGPARDAARRTMLSVFTLAAADPALVGRYRRLLASALN